MIFEEIYGCYGGVILGEEMCCGFGGYVMLNEVGKGWKLMGSEVR